MGSSHHLQSHNMTVYLIIFVGQLFETTLLNYKEICLRAKVDMKLSMSLTCGHQHHFKAILKML